MKFRIVTKLLAPSLGMILLGAGGVGLLATWKSFSVFHAQTGVDLNRESRQTVSNMDAWLSGRMADAQAWGSLPVIKAATHDPSLYPAASQELSALVKPYPYYFAINLISLDGNVVLSSTPKGVGINLSERPYFQKAKAGEANVSDVFVSKATGTPIFNVAVPVRNAEGSATEGVLFMPVRMEAFAGLFLKDRHSEDGSYAFMTDEKGRILAHPDTTLILKKSLSDLPIGKFLGTSDSEFNFNLEGHPYTVAKARLQTGWTLWIVKDKTQQEAFVSQLGWAILIFVLIAAAVACVVNVLALRPIVSTLTAASAFAVKVGNGDTRGRLSCKREDEVGDLVRALDRMADLLSERAELAHRIARRDLTMDVEVHSPNDSLGQAFRQMVAQLREVIAAVRDGVESTASAANELEGVSRAMANASEETSSQAREVDRLGEGVSHEILSISSGSEEMELSIGEISKNATQAAATGNEAVHLATRAQETVDTLAEASQAIGKVVDVIQEIAGQTKLLALNATIEAARAGEAGKGFSIVAQEVKQLSLASENATSDIRKKINTIQTDMSQAGAHITAVTAIIRRIDEFSQSIAGAVEEQTATTREISRSIANVSGGVADISRAVGGVSEAASANASSAGDTRVASERLTQLASRLAGLVKEFQLP